MVKGLADSLDLALAWKRVEADVSGHRTFFEHPFQLELIKEDLERWLDSLRQRVAGGYQPGPCGFARVPKPHGGIRPGANLDLADQVVYAALLQHLRSHIGSALGWSRPEKDYAHVLHDDPSSTAWFQKRFQRWKAFDRDSLALIDKGLDVVITADIAGYYELVDFPILLSDLRAAGAPPDALDVLMKCLNRWARVPGRGIPQGFSTSDILGKLYLNAVDRALADRGVVHVRWVDDFRIFCERETDARRVLADFVGLLGARGLVVQSAKTRIRPGAEARVRFHQVHAVLEPIREQFYARLVAVGLIEGPSASAAFIDELLSNVEADAPVEVLRDAFDAYFVKSEHEFNKTLLRFLLRRLGSAKDPHALDTAMSFLHKFPEETETVLTYASDVSAVERAESEWMRLVGEHLVAYEYQEHQVMRWRLAEDVPPSDDYLRWVRSIAFDGGVVAATRSYARATLARWGSSADLDRLQSAYPNAQSDLERAEIVRSLGRMERGKRNAFLARVGSDGDLTAVAARITRALP